jgi:endonuclease/exonuclease/phosphatase family metal-dependent hydrolase
VRMTSGGLAIVSRYPIDLHEAEPFSHRSCVGFDCLSNKGALFAKILIPGVPDPIQVFDTHMNSRRSSGAATERTLASHHVESRELADFIAAASNPALPTLLGGDFNMRHSAARFAAFERAQPLTLVHRYCRDIPGACDVRIAWKSGEPWMETQDLQLFRPGARVDILPMRVETMFDGRGGGPRLSDHDALRVTYDVSWPVGALPRAGACPAQGQSSPPPPRSEGADGKAAVAGTRPA